MFGRLAAEKRRLLGLTQEGLAALTGLSVRSIRDVENGRVRQPRPSTVRLLSDALDIPPDQRAGLFDTTPGDPPAPAVVRPAQLPLEVPQFVGRSAELAALDAFADAGPQQPDTVVISTVSGMAGIGKTALALHWAHRQAGRFPDGQLYVDLRGFDDGDAALDPSVALRGFLEALDVADTRMPATLQGRSGLFRSLLSVCRMLVVLDNARDVAQVRPLLPGSGRSVVLVTSRDRLSGLTAQECARPLTLEVLTADEARSLLAHRLGAARLAAEPEAVAAIVGSTGRLPLALSIVAARAAAQPAFPLAAIAAELRPAGSSEFRPAGTGAPGPAGTSLDALTDGDVRRVFSWSYRALSPDAARVFRLLGLHPGPDLTAGAAAALAGQPAAVVVPLLRELTRLHLLTEHAPGRYTFHDLLRVYAAELARDHEEKTGQRAACRRLYDFYLHSAFPAAVRLQPQWQAIEPVAPLPGSAGHAVTGHEEALAFFTAEHKVLLRVIPQAAAAGFEAYAWQLAWSSTAFFAPRGLWHHQLAVQRTALAAAERIGDLAGQAVASRLLARAEERLGNHDTAERHLQCAFRLHERLDDPNGQAQTLHNYGELCLNRGRPRDGLGHALAALPLYRKVGNRAGEARTLNAIGWLYATMGDYARAIESCGEALTHQQQSGDSNGQAATLDSLGFAYDGLGDHARAAESYELAVRLFRESADRYHEAETLNRLGGTRATMGDSAAATEALRRAARIYDDLGDATAADVRARLAALPGPQIV